VVRVGRVEPSALHVAGDGVVILLRVVAEEREPEAAFALEGAVAGAAVAAHPAEQAHDVAFEVHLVDDGAIGQNDGRTAQRRNCQDEGGGDEGAAESDHTGRRHSSILLIGSGLPSTEEGGRSTLLALQRWSFDALLQLTSG